MKTRSILLGLGLLGAALTCSVGAMGWWGMHGIGVSMDATVVATQATQAATMGDMMHDALRGDVFQALMYAQSNDAEGVKVAQADAAEHGAGFIQRISELRALPLKPEVAQGAAAVAPVVERYAAKGKEVTELAATDLPAALAQLPAFVALFKELEEGQEKVIEAIEVQAKAVGLAAQAQRRQANMTMLFATLAGTLVLLGLAVLVSRHLMHTLGAEPSQVRSLLHRVAQGELNLSIQLAANDKHSVLAGLADMAGQLKHTVGTVRTNADGMAGAASQVHAGSAYLAERTQAQASALEESVAALTLLDSALQQSVSTAHAARERANAACTVAQRGGEVVGNVVQTMDGIQQSSRKIADIIAVIDGIAFQTNILALNAAVEAARAGEQGRGFAVVASEVRALAGRSANAAREIKQLIDNSVSTIAQGSHQVQQAGVTMAELVGSVNQVSDMIGEMAAAAGDQSAGVRQVHEAVDRLDNLTQQNATMVEESTAAANGLKDQAQLLNELVHHFQVDGKPGDHAAPARMPTPTDSAAWQTA